jgi:HEAT repeat protein
VLKREDRKVKLLRDPSHTVDLALKVAALHAAMGETRPALLDACEKALNPDIDANLRRAALLVAAHAGAVGARLAVPMLKDDVVLKDPKLGTQIVLSARGTDLVGSVAARALEVLRTEKPKTVGAERLRDYELFRTALLEVVIEQSVKKGGMDAATRELVIQQMKASRSWRVRRAALCGLARLGDRKALPNIIAALNDPHAVVQQLALAAGVAFTAKDAGARARHLKRLGRGPQPKVYREVCRTEGLDYDRLAVNRDEARKIILKRAGM